MPESKELSDEETQTENDTLPENEDPETDTQPESEPEESDAEEQEPTGDEDPEQDPPPAPQPKPDPVRRLKEQAREVQPTLHRAKQAEARIEQLTKTEPPTETELRQEFPDYDQANPQTQRVYRELLVQRKKTNKVEHLLLDNLEQQKWEEDLARVVRDNPKLKGQEAAFKVYAYKPAHRTVPSDVLVKSFLFELDESPPPATPPKPRGSALERGSGGPRQPETPGEITSEQAAIIRKTDPQRYRKLILTGKIKDEI